MFWGVLHRTILLELGRVFSLSLITLTGLILLGGIISEAMKNGLSPMQILIAIPLMLPSLLPYTVPTTTLFAVCTVYGRLSADNEIIALKAVGVHILHIIWPALALGVLAGGVTMFLYLDAIPTTSVLLKSQAVRDVEESLYTMLRRDACLRHQKLAYEIHVHQIEGRILHDVIFKRKSSDGKSFDTVARAREAELHVDLASKQILVVMRQCQIAQGPTVGYLDHHIWAVALPDVLRGAGQKPRASDMRWAELGQYEQEWSEDCERLKSDIDKHQRWLDRGQHFREHVDHLLKERRTCESQIQSIHCETHLRPALALSCFCFALVGCPVGIWFSKSDHLSAFVTCFLPIVIIYYPLLFCTLNLARAGKVAPWLAIYAADAILLFAGVVLFRRLARN